MYFNLLVLSSRNVILCQLILHLGEFICKKVQSFIHSSLYLKQAGRIYITSRHFGPTMHAISRYGTPGLT